MKRREFITLLGGAATMPLVAHAQTSVRTKRIGWLVGIGPDAQDPMQQAVRRAFDQEMVRLGWTEGRMTRVDGHTIPGDDTRLRASAAELLAQAPDVIVANGTQAASILQRATKQVPVVFANVADPVANGIVASMARPGGNITGFASVEFSVAGKWLGILKEIAPSLTRTMALYYQANENWTGYLPTIEAAARSIGVTLNPVGATTFDEIAQKIETFAREPGGGMIVLPSGLMGVNRERIATLCIQHRLPAIYPYGFYANSGGLVSYGSDYVDLYRRAASYVDRILRGEKPSDLPVQAPVKFEMIINLKTANAIGLTVPTSLRLLADEVIE